MGLDDECPFPASNSFLGNVEEHSQRNSHDNKVVVSEIDGLLDCLDIVYKDLVGSGTPLTLLVHHTAYHPPTPTHYNSSGYAA